MTALTCYQIFNIEIKFSKKNIGVSLGFSYGDMRELVDRHLRICYLGCMKSPAIVKISYKREELCNNEQ